MAKKRVDKPHFKFINSLPCCKSGQQPLSDCAHIRKGTDGGMGLRPSPWFTVPLSSEMHMEQHRVGEPVFWGDDLERAIALGKSLYDISGDVEKGEELIISFRRM